MVIKRMAKSPHITPMLNPHLCARVNKNTEQILYAPNAVHFWGGMEHVPSLALEMAMKVDENFENMVKSWSYVIDQVNIYYMTSKRRMALEDQVLRVFIATQYATHLTLTWSIPLQAHEHAQRQEFPVNVIIEMRFLKASQMIMSNMYDEDPDAIFATLELVSAVNTKGFEEFSAKMAQHWMENHGSQ